MPPRGSRRSRRIKSGRVVKTDRKETGAPCLLSCLFCADFPAVGEKGRAERETKIDMCVPT